MNSLQHRLNLGLALSLGILMLAFWFLGHHALHHMMERFAASRLEHDAEAMLLALDFDAEGRIDLDTQRVTPIYQQPLSGHYYVLSTEDGQRLISRSLWDQDLDGPDLAPGEHRSWHTDGPQGQHLLVLALGYERKGRALTLALAEDVSPIREVLMHYEALFGLVSASGILLLVLVQRQLVRSGFRQLQPVYDDMRRLERGEIEALTEDVPVELAPLVSKFNALLRLLDQRLERSRNALGNLAHALKTPLALLTQQLERKELEAVAPLRRDMEIEVERIRSLMERELKRARLAGSGGAGQHFTPAEEIPFLLEVLSRMYAGRPIQVETAIPAELVIEADREDMLELLGNLLDNAYKWAKDSIRVSARQQETAVELIVEDDGPGSSDALLDELTHRGVRLDEQKEGHGLGLTIARDIASLYGARLELGRSPDLGGFRAVIQIPISTDQAFSV